MGSRVARSQSQKPASRAANRWCGPAPLRRTEEPHHITEGGDVNEFRFSIGDMVAAKAAIAELDLRSPRAATAADDDGLFLPVVTPKALIVVERLAQTCPDGTQLHYACKNDGTAIRYLEIELVPWDEAVKAHNEAHLNALRVYLDAYRARKDKAEKP